MGASYSQGDIHNYWNKVDVSGNANLLQVGQGGKITKYELNGNGKCNRLPGHIEVSTRDREVQQKRIFITVPGDKRNLRLYIDDECETRANEEAYMKKTTFNNQNILYFPADPQQNAEYYKVNHTEPNKPPLPFFMVTPEPDAKRRFAAERAISDCRPIPFVSSGENYHAVDGKDAAFQRDLSHMTLYTDSNCTNIFDQTKEEIDRVDNSYIPFSITTNPYNVVTGYGGRPMEKTKARYYMIKNEKWNVINDIDPVKLAAAKARREELARLKAEEEERQRQAALEARRKADQDARDQALREKRAADMQREIEAKNAQIALVAIEQAKIMKKQRDMLDRMFRTQQDNSLATHLAYTANIRRQQMLDLFNPPKAKKESKRKGKSRKRR